VLGCRFRHNGYRRRSTRGRRNHCPPRPAAHASSRRDSVPAVPRDWDAETYDSIADPQFRWGAAVVDRLDLDGDETVLDAGCGSGRVTALLAERLPDGSVVALDGSTSMLETGALRPGGRLVAQCGGAGNLAGVVRVLEGLGADPFTGKVFATPERTAERLR